MAQIRTLRGPLRDGTPKTATMDAPPPRRRRRLPRPAAAAALLPLLALASSLCLVRLPAASAFAAWFVDRRLSCLTDLAPGEIVMNNGVVAHSSSREPSIRVEVTPLTGSDDGAPGSEYVARFVVPPDVRARLKDVQYVLDLSAGASDFDPAATFTSSPPDGGIGCDGWRSHARVAAGGEESAAVLTINNDAKEGDRIEVVAGWATGHEAVTLTAKAAIVVGRGVVGQGGGAAAERDDDTLDDDEAEAELEESFIEEEREELENEIEEAEEDAVEALEEKRIETEGLGKAINEAEEEVVEALEESKKNVNRAMDSLKDEIITEQEEKKKDAMKRHMHNMKERMEAQRKHREAHERKKRDEGKLEEMQRRFAKQAQEMKKDKLEELMYAKDRVRDSITRLKKKDTKEHERARKEHIKPLPKEELRLDMQELKQKAKEKMEAISDRMGVNELMNDPRMQEIRGKLRKGYVRGSAYEGDVGQPLPPRGRHFLFVMFGMFGLVGFVRWFLDKRRRARKGKRNL